MHTLLGLDQFFAFEDVETAEKHFRKALEQNTQFSPGLVALGELERTTFRFEEAKETYKQALREDPQEPIALTGFLEVCMEER